MAQEPVIVRKYENRRLYDTAASRYVNLDEIAEMVRQGVEIRVVDVKTGEDITRVILTQIIVEDAKGRDSGLPLDFLRQLVIASGKASQEHFGRYMKAMFDTYQNAYDTFRNRLRETAPIAVTPLDFMQAMFNPRPAAPLPERDESPEPPRGAARSDGELTELLKRVEGLEKRLAGAKRPKRRRKR